MACPPIIFFDLSFWWARKKNKTVGNTIFEEALPTLPDYSSITAHCKAGEENVTTNKLHLSPK